MTFTTLVQALSFAWKRGPGLLTLTILLHIVQGLFPGIALWVMKNLINAVSGLILSNEHHYGGVILLLAIQFLLELLSSFAQNTQDYLNQVLQLRLDHDLQLAVAEKTTQCPASYFELPEFFDHVNRTMGSQGARFYAPISSAFDIGRSFITMGSILTFLLSIHWALVVLSVVTAVPIFVIQSKLGQAKFSLFFEMTPLAREQAYLTQLFRDRQAAKEIRLFGLGNHLMQRWSKLFAINSKETLHLQRKQRSANVSLDSLSGLFYALAGGVIVWLLKKASISIGAFVTVGQAVQSMQTSINSISLQFAKLIEEGLYIQAIFAFLNFQIPELEVSAGNQLLPRPLREGIHLEQVSYRYPDSPREILQNINLTIRPGEKLAIVGENGSGKTTLVKCLMGLYPVSGGRITFDGVEIRDIDQASLHRGITVIFQDFMRYPFSLRDNILFGNIEADEQAEAFREAAVASGVDEFAAKLPDGYDTRLGRLFSRGDDLSGGQWQKVALARALYRDGELLILDEPTAALDPLAELEIFQQFRALSEGKTTLFISHRMSATRMADRILVMKEGHLIESGTHEELMQLGTEYARMYQSQHDWFAK